LEKSKVIEKLFSYTLIYSFLLLPLLFIFRKTKRTTLTYILATYGLLFFLYLCFYYNIPKSFKKVGQSLYTLTEYSVFSFTIWYHIETKKFRKLIVGFSIGFLIFQFYYYLKFSRQVLDSIPIGIETILLLFFAFLYFRECLKYNLTFNIYEYQSFWLVVGILIYLGSSFFFNILANEVSSKQLENFWYYTYIPEIIKNLLFAVVVLGYPLKHTIQKNITASDIPKLDMI
jgi:hypothetical protein